MKSEKERYESKLCCICNREIYGTWDGDYSITKRKTKIWWHKECLKQQNQKNKIYRENKMWS